ncbi:MAG: M48 family metalloprotease, partial [Desulfovibrio sp.]|nr:M48 family metalloprotease [Desulfovibrio sp.]
MTICPSLLRRIPAWFLAATLVVQVSPAPAHAFFFGGVTIKDEKEMGRKFDAMIRSNLSVIDDPEVRQYVMSLTDRLVRAMPKQPYSFNSSVILNNALNAFAVPGGYIYVFSGLIMNFDSEDELAGVMAHELAHVTQRHVASRLERAQFVTLGSLLLAVAGIAAGGSGGGAVAVSAMSAGQAAMLNYSRLDETDADQIGLQYLVAAGYPPGGMVNGFKVLRQKSMMSGTSVPAYLSTHPAIGERINTLQSKIAAMPDKVREKPLDNRRFKRVNTLLWARYGDEQAALQRFSKNDALSCMGRGIVLNRLNRIPQASAAFDGALAGAPSDSLVLREAGMFHFRRGEMRRAEELL